MQIAPCYYVTGNHEAWIGPQFSELEEKLLAENAERTCSRRAIQTAFSRRRYRSEPETLSEI